MENVPFETHLLRDILHVIEHASNGYSTEGWHQNTVSERPIFLARYDSLVQTNCSDKLEAKAGVVDAL